MWGPFFGYGSFKAADVECLRSCPPIVYPGTVSNTNITAGTYMEYFKNTRILGGHSIYHIV